MKLTIVSVSEKKPVGDKGAVKLAFRATDQDGNNLEYFTFVRNLFDHIKVGDVIEAEVETSQREWGGNTYVDRKVTGIAGVATPSKGGFRNDPDQRASIECQVAAKLVTEMQIAKVPVSDVLITARNVWLTKALGIPLIHVLTPPPSNPEAVPATPDLDAEFLAFRTLVGSAIGHLGRNQEWLTAHIVEKHNGADSLSKLTKPQRKALLNELAGLMSQEGK